MLRIAAPTVPSAGPRSFATTVSAAFCVFAVVLGASGCDGSAIETLSTPVDESDSPTDNKVVPKTGDQPTCLADAECAPLATGPCVIAACDEGRKKCVVGLAPEFAVCDDGNPCASEAMCRGGVCRAVQVKACDDGNPCTADRCDATTGDCAHEPRNAGCDDGNPCTAADACKNGACVGTVNVCECATNADCASKSGGDKCLGTLVCSSGKCMTDISAVKACPDDKPCKKARCDPSTGGCVYDDLPDKTACDDGSVCTNGDFCSGGACTSGATISCAAGAPCHEAACDPKKGCVVSAEADGKACDDGSKCTKDDRCAGGVCGGISVCECAAASDCVNKTGDVAACLGQVVCHGGACAIDPSKATPCGDGGECELSLCSATGCAKVGLPSGAPCDDGNACTVGDNCSSGGNCKNGIGGNCDDGNPCTIDQCDLAAGCTWTDSADGTDCDDGQACSKTSSCNLGVCQPGSSICDDGKACTFDWCDPADPTGSCLSVGLADGAKCDDGNACSLGGSCSEGECVATKTKACNDGNPCTTDGCMVGDAGELVCDFAPLPANQATSCDDSDPCTTDDFCTDGQCKGTPGGCECQQASDCANKEDGNLCNGTLVCAAGKCALDPLSVVNCKDSNSKDSTSPCTDVICQPKTGQCVEQPKDEVGGGKKIACNDGNPCTTGETCLAGGGCGGGGPVLCDDGKPCTVDACDTKSGCVATPAKKADGLPCDDGNNCTKGDICGPGGCESGKNACQCAKDADCATFDDGNACNGTLKCSEGACVPKGDAVVCTGKDAPACQTYRCIESTGSCGFVALPTGSTCTDGDTCPAPGSCQTGKCITKAAPCDDGKVCTVDACDAATKQCTHVVSANKPCDDGDACTEGTTCDSQGACIGGNDVCTCAMDGDCKDDGDLCNGVPSCVDKKCGIKPGSVVNCDKSGDGPCRTNVCEAKTGKCAIQQKPAGATCDDGDACTETTTCSGPSCTGGTKKACNDNNPCTSDGCSPANGCFFTNNTASCDDGNACTVNDRCAAGQCVPGTNACDCKVNSDCKNDSNLCNGTLFCIANKCQLDPKSVITCDKANDTNCRANLCDTKTGKCAMTSFPEGTNCDDASVCTSKDRCQSGVCKGDLFVCDDKNPCSADTCDPKAGCKHQALNGDKCDDGNACTQGESCDQGVCKGGKDVCGVCQTDADCAKQDDGNLCNGTLRCAAGKCEAKPGSVVTCNDDGNPCTAVACVPSTGKCATTTIGNGGACNDGNACTTASICTNGSCVGTGSLTCDDGKDCTTDSCDPKTGCRFVITPAKACNDGNSCTTGDVCLLDGTCSGLNTCDCTKDSDCASKEDGNACNGTLSCQAGKCAIKPGSVVVCNTSGDNACTTTACNPKTGTCGKTVLKDGTACDDGKLCTVDDACANGSCAAKPRDCSDGQACTTDSCDAAKGCVHVAVNDGTICDDGNSCTVGDTCKGGSCAFGNNTCQCKANADCGKFEDGNACNGTLICTNNACVVDPATVVTCSDDGNPCTASSCDAKTGKCATASATNGSICGGTVLCGGSGTCQSGTCIGSHGCSDDGSPCTEATCDGKGTCGQNNLTGACNDGDICTTGDTCSGGKCVGKGQCQCKVNADCTGFDDGNKCNGVFTCQSGQCKYDAKTVVTCPGTSGPCITIACQASTGKCIAKERPSGTTCDDGNKCTKDTQCASGKCLGKKVDCNDDNPCTTDSCNATNGCQNPPTTGSLTCDDNDPCTPASVCFNGKCNGIFNQCTCQKDSDCQDDADKCNGTPSCQSGTCKPKPGTEVKCPASTVACFENQCTKATGKCVLQPMPTGSSCDDGTKCTGGDVCTLGKCVGIAVNCDDKVSCTNDACDPKTGCSNTADASKCNDNNACTLDECDKITGCKTTAKIGAPCDDKSNCTTGETCQVSPKGPVCGGGVNLACDDKNPCTADSCDSSGTTPGCVFKPITGTCNDNDACTSSDTCTTGKCVGTPKSCADSDPCTNDSCDPKTGACSNVGNSGGPCDDGNKCTTGETCASGSCAGGKPTNCDDGNVCTDDSCPDKSGCKSTNNTKGCDDGSGCTLGDTCTNGSCQSGLNKNCDDSNSCTADSCDTKTGQCVNKTGAGTCSDGDQCTSDVCDVQTAKCVSTIKAGLACDDGNACSSGDVCDAQGKCEGKGGCDDGNSCTDDACSGGKCVTTNNTGPCDDGNPCTKDEACKDGICSSPNPVTGCCAKDSDCGDDFPCTTDSCANGQCQVDAVVCKDDGTACTVEACKDGKCGSFVPGTFAPVVLYEETFDDGKANGISRTATNNKIAWSVRNNRSASSPNAHYVGDPATTKYDAGTSKTSFTLPKLSIPTAGDFALTFKYFMAVADGGCDKDRLTISATDGTTTLTDQVCATTASFTERNVSLSGTGKDLRGKVVTITFTFDTVDASNNNAEGVYIDDIRVVGTSAAKDCCKGASDCNDGNQCTFDLCDAKTGKCGNPPNVNGFCDDGSLCTSQDLCTAQAVCEGVKKDCSDGDACTADDCDPKTGKCSNPQFATHKQNFNTNTDGFTFQSSNNQIKWQLSTLQPSSAPSALYVGNINDAGKHSYNFGATLATATYKQVAIPTGAKTAFVRFKYRFDTAEGPTCANFPLPTDRIQLLINGQSGEQSCKKTTGYEQVSFDLKDHIGKSLTVGLRFIANPVNNNAQGAWFDDFEIGWTCQ